MNSTNYRTKKIDERFHMKLTRKGGGHKVEIHCNCNKKFIRLKENKVLIISQATGHKRVLKDPSKPHGYGNWDYKLYKRPVNLTVSLACENCMVPVTLDDVKNLTTLALLSYGNMLVSR